MSTLSNKNWFRTASGFDGGRGVRVPAEAICLIAMKF
jgi:hypothetical protein